MRRRLSAAYHIERSLAARLGLPEYPCACDRCRGARIKKVHTVAKHHIAYGRDPYLIYPVMVSVDTQNLYVVVYLNFQAVSTAVPRDCHICSELVLCVGVL